MHTLVALLVTAAAVCALARPPGPTAVAPLSPEEAHSEPRRVYKPFPPLRVYLDNYMVPKFLLPHYVGGDESPRLVLQPARPPRPPPLITNTDWLNKEIDRINLMDEEDQLMNPYDADVDVARWMDPYMRRAIESSLIREPKHLQEFERPGYYLLNPTKGLAGSTGSQPAPEPQRETKRHSAESDLGTRDDHKKLFALTPLDKEYFEPIVKPKYLPEPSSNAHRGDGEPRTAMVLEPPRQTRQNPNLNKQKHLLEPDLVKLKTGLANKDYRLPVSLLPTNLRWLKVKQPIDDEESSHEDGDATDKPRHIHLSEMKETDTTNSVYGLALIAVVGAALTMAIFGFAFGWYTLSKRAKAAADVDYPAYGVTGPTMDASGDRKLAHSAHMYHYQHQKQQIIAMERNGLDGGTGSVSDPESEEENEEGDYTVYECPGFATTGDIEVKNPLFSEPTPATPGKVELVKQQTKE